MKICPSCDGDCWEFLEVPWPTNNSKAYGPKYQKASCFTCNGMGMVDDDVMEGDNTGCNNDPDGPDPDDVRNWRKDR